MDFGATVCVARKPKCAVCPMTKLCTSFPVLSSPAATDRFDRKKPRADELHGSPTVFDRADGQCVSRADRLPPEGGSHDAPTLPAPASSGSCSSTMTRRRAR